MILSKDLTMKNQLVTRIVRLCSDTPNYRIDAFSFKADMFLMKVLRKSVDRRIAFTEMVINFYEMIARMINRFY